MEIYIQKLQEIASKKRGIKGSLAYKSALEALSNVGRKVSTGKNTGSGRYSSSTCWTTAAADLISQVLSQTDNGAVVETGNDSPRGGRSGEYVIIKG